MAAAHAIVEHRLARRMRLRVPTRRGASAYFDALAACLSRHPDVTEVQANPMTGGVLVLHRGAEAAILEDACKRGLITLTPPARPTRELPSANAALAVGLGVLAAVQLARGRVLGPASELIWNAYALSSLLRGSALMPVLAIAILIRLGQGPLLGSASSLLFYALAARELARREREALAAPDPDEEPLPH